MGDSVEKPQEGDPNNKGGRQLKNKPSFEKTRTEGELRDKFKDECERLLKVFKSNRPARLVSYYDHIATEYFKYKPEVERLLGERKGLWKDLHPLQQEPARVKSEITKHEPLSLARQVVNPIVARFMDPRMDQLVKASRRLLSDIEDNEKKLGENLDSLNEQKRQILSQSGRRSINIVESAKLFEKTKEDAERNLKRYEHLNPNHREALQEQYEDLEKSLEDYKQG